MSYCAGSLALGTLTDRFHVTTVILISTIGSMIAAFVFWGLTNSQALLYIFAMTWGMFAGGYPATWAGCAALMRRRNQSTGGNINTGLIIALFAACKGVGAVISGPLSEKLLEVGSKWHAQFAYGSGYGVLIVFSGVSAMLGGAAWVGRLLRLV
jgi:MFS family permease